MSDDHGMKELAEMLRSLEPGSYRLVCGNVMDSPPIKAEGGCYFMDIDGSMKWFSIWQDKPL